MRVEPLGPDMARRFHVALERMAGSRFSNWIPLAVLAPLFPVGGYLLGAEERVANIAIGAVFGLLVGIFGYFRARAYQRHFAPSIKGLGLRLDTPKAEYGKPIEFTISVEGNIETKASNLSYGLVGWSVASQTGPIGRLRSEWKSRQIYADWHLLEHGTGARSYTLPVPANEDDYLPKPEPIDLKGPIGLHHHTTWVVAVRWMRYGVEWHRTQRIATGLPRQRN